MFVLFLPKSLLLTSHSPTVMQRRLSELQKVILEELNKAKNKVMNPSNLSYAVASRYAPDKIWRLKDCKEPMVYAVARSCHRNKECIKNVFSASFSRALKNMEEKKLVQLVRGLFEGKIEGDSYMYYRIKTPQPRITLVIHHESPYFGKEAPDVDRLIDICNEIKFSPRC